jgi:GMP synthase-like glutamine amidotransferase
LRPILSKNILLVNNEWSPDDPGCVKAGMLPGFEDEFCHVRNLVDVISSLPGVIVHTVFHNDLSMESVDRFKPDCIIAGGRLKSWDFETISAEYATECELIRKSSIPFLGICAGHQLISVAYGKKIGRMVESSVDMYELGFVQVEVTQPDILFRGFTGTPRLMMAHRDEIRELPEGFINIASTEMCRYAAIRHKSRPIWGVQFHPEITAEGSRDGLRVLSNFMAMQD